MTSSERTVVFAELWMQPGKRLELETAAEHAGALLRRHPDFVAGRLLHFSGGPYFYRYEMTGRAAPAGRRSGPAATRPTSARSFPRGCCNRSPTPCMR